MNGKREVRMSNQPHADEIKAMAAVIAALNELCWQDQRKVLVAALTLLERESLSEGVRGVR